MMHLPVGGFAVLMSLECRSGRGLTIVVLSNRAEVDAPALAQRIADLYFAKR
jgi:hypothetical protein